MTITLSINHEKNLEFPAGVSLQEALIANGHTQGHFAVAVNKTFIPKSQYAHTLLQAGDQIDVLAPMQGG